MSVYICVSRYISVCMYVYVCVCIYVCVYMHTYSTEKFTVNRLWREFRTCTLEISIFAVSFLAQEGACQLCRGNGDRARVSGGARRGMATNPTLIYTWSSPEAHSELCALVHHAVANLSSIPWSWWDRVARRLWDLSPVPCPTKFLGIILSSCWGPI